MPDPILNYTSEDLKKQTKKILNDINYNEIKYKDYDNKGYSYVLAFIVLIIVFSFTLLSPPYSYFIIPELFTAFFIVYKIISFQGSVRKV